MPAIPTSHRVRQLRPTAVNSILAEVKQLQAEGRKLVSLMRGEPDFRTPAHIVEAAERALRNGRTGYADNRGELPFREAVAAKLKFYDPATEILITTGATFGIHAALTALLNDGDEVLLPEPVYDAYHSPILLAGGVIRSVPSQIVNGRFTLDVAGLEAACTARCRVMLLNTPWNPTGTVFTREELEAIGEFVLRHNLILLSDEIYESITYEDHVHISPIALSPELRARTVLINSFSKTYAMPGWRAGYCAAPATITQAMFLVLQQSSRGPATFVQDAATEALQGPQDCVAVMRQEYTNRRATVCRELSGMASCRVLAPEGGFFAMLDISALHTPSNEIRRKLMREHGVVVVHGSAYGPSGEGTLRVSFASGGDNLTRGLEKLRAGLES
ncbi:MAG TPA: aminotransferase class I/II-fold pyridoxal phosphate-dependent enzyme [Bryobacteraceae bacterium]|nr:aminotransferase class I/II-fold pyridoxal phosphate-dependent enzyme [Bryobacteraceae bacterium]